MKLFFIKSVSRSNFDYSATVKPRLYTRLYCNENITNITYSTGFYCHRADNSTANNTLFYSQYNNMLPICIKAL